MDTNQPNALLASDADWATYVDTLKKSGAPRRAMESGIATAPATREKQKAAGAPVSWAEYIDRIYIEELMRRQDH